MDGHRRVLNYTPLPTVKKAANEYESQDYTPSHSVVYQEYLKNRPVTHGFYRGLTTAFIGVLVGLIGFALHLLIDAVNDRKWSLTKQYLADSDILTAWLFTTGYSLAFVLFSTVIVTFYRPSAAGSGIPELMGFLNGTAMRHIFNIRTLVVKFLSCIAAVGSGLPIGQEGPMIHIGSMVGAGVSSFKSDTLGFNFRILRHFRNALERRNFVKAGAAAGVSSAFHAPIGGLLFVMEEVSTIWRLVLTWQTFFCCILATFTASLFGSAFSDFYYNGNFGMFTKKDYIMFPTNAPLCLSILAFLPALILGILGGLLGALFVKLHLAISNVRQRLLSCIRGSVWQKFFKVFECLLISVLWSSLTILVPHFWPCTQVKLFNATDPALEEANREEFVYARFILDNKTYGEDICSNDTSADITIERCSCSNCSYNELATLMWSTGSDAITHLFMRHTFGMFHYCSLFTLLFAHFIGAAWTSSASLASGLLIPMVLIGALYGRILGEVAIDVVGVVLPVTEGLYSWVDPGGMALIGAASFYAGVSRTMVSVAVIMVEMTNTVDYLLPVTFAVMVAKWTGDYFSYPLYHCNLERKGIPYLEDEPKIVLRKKRLNLENFSAKHVMAEPPVTLQLHETVARIAGLLLDTEHGGFPVVHTTENQEVLVGSINRNELIILLMHPELFTDERGIKDQLTSGAISYELTNVEKFDEMEPINKMLQTYANTPEYNPRYICLDAYVNQSVVSVSVNFSLQRTYTMFRALGLRHIYVTDSLNRVVGVITRKDLQKKKMVERLEYIEQSEISSDLSFNCHNSEPHIQ